MEAKCIFSGISGNKVAAKKLRISAALRYWKLEFALNAESSTETQSLCPGHGFKWTPSKWQKRDSNNHFDRAKECARWLVLDKAMYLESPKEHNLIWNRVFIVRSFSNAKDYFVDIEVGLCKKGLFSEANSSCLRFIKSTVLQLLLEIINLQTH